MPPAATGPPLTPRQIEPLNNLTSLSGCPLQVPPARRQHREEKRWSYICPSFCLHQNSAWGGKNNGWVMERRATNRLEVSERSRSGGADLRREGPHQMCLIGSGVCRMATRDPPWFRKKMLYSSWKICGAGTSVCFLNRWHHAKKHTSPNQRQMRAAFRGLMSEMRRWHKFSGFICFINKSCTYFAKGWLSNHLCLTSLLPHWSSEKQKQKVGVEGWVRFPLLFT